MGEQWDGLNQQIRQQINSTEPWIFQGQNLVLAFMWKLQYRNYPIKHLTMSSGVLLLSPHQWNKSYGMSGERGGIREIGIMIPLNVLYWIWKKCFLEMQYCSFEIKGYFSLSRI